MCTKAKNDIDEKIFDFAYEMAMRDATMMKAYQGDKKAPKECKGAKEIVREYIDSLLNDTADNFYKAEDKFYKVEDEFEKTINEELGNPQPPKFTFGNCQKVINMTAKYIFIATYANKELRKNFENCHCPMDSIMINAVIGKLKEKIKEGELEYDGTKCESVNDFLEVINDKRELKIDNPNITYLRGSWSNIKKGGETIPPQYALFQEVVKYLAETYKKSEPDKKGVSPIEYDYLIWNSPDAGKENKEQ